MRVHRAEATYKNLNISAGARNLVEKKHFKNMTGKKKQKKQQKKQNKKKQERAYRKKRRDVRC